MRPLAGILILLASAGATDESVEVGILRKHQLRPDAQSLAAYLRSLSPDEELRGRVSHWIEMLGSGRPAQRIEATRRLGALGAAPLLALEGASRDPDPEIARRARRLVRHSRAYLSSELMVAVYRTISRRRIPGLAREVIATIGICPQRYVLLAGRRALSATATHDDVSRLRGLIRSGAVQLQVAAIHALCAVRGQAAREELRALLIHERARVRCAAAWALADLGDHDCLGPLGSLLGSAEVEVRLRAWRALRLISATRFGYAPYESRENRAAPRDAWLEWIRTKGSRARWETPLRPGDVARGRILLALAGERRVVELDPDGKKVWELAHTPSPWAVEGTSNGHRLIAWFENRAIVEYDEAGVVVWRMKDLPGKPCSVQRLLNGNTLVAIGSAGKVIEYRPDKTVAWEVTLKGRPFWARRISNGRTLISLHDTGRIVEVDQKRRVTEKFRGLRGPYSVQPLDNGNALVCLPGAGRVVELAPDGREVWSVAGLGWPASAFRLANGHTLVAHQRGVEEIWPGGTRRWIVQTHGSVFMSRY